MENARVHDERLAIGDAFGEILLACQRAGGASGVAYELVERSDGFLAVADAARYFSTDPDPALELACGPASWARPPIRTRRPGRSTSTTTSRTGGLDELPGQLRLRVRHERTVTPWWDYLLCTPEELEEVIGPTTWTLAGAQVRPRPSAQWSRRCCSAPDAVQLANQPATSATTWVAPALL
jgi:hypothetical protein